MTYALSILLIDGNQYTTQDSTYSKEIMSEINSTKEISKGILRINLKSI